MRGERERESYGVCWRGRCSWQKIGGEGSQTQSIPLSSSQMKSEQIRRGIVSGAVPIDEILTQLETLKQHSRISSSQPVLIINYNASIPHYYYMFIPFQEP